MFARSNYLIPTYSTFLNTIVNGLNFIEKRELFSRIAGEVTF